MKRTPEQNCRLPLEKLLGFDPDHGWHIEIQGLAPWIVPPWVDPRDCEFEGFDGNDFVAEDEKVRLIHQGPDHTGRRRLSRTRRPELRRHPDAQHKKPDNFSPRIEWERLQALRQELRAALPRPTSPDPMKEFAADLEQSMVKILGYLEANPKRRASVIECLKYGVPAEDSEFAMGVALEYESGCRARAELNDEMELRALTEEGCYVDEATCGASETASPSVEVNPCDAPSEGTRSEPGRPRTIRLFFDICARYIPKITAMELAVIAGLERDYIGSLDEKLQSYFDDPTAAQSAWGKNLPRYRKEDRG